MDATLVKVFVISLEKHKILSYKQKIATMFKVLHKVLQNSFSFAGHTNTYIVFVSVQPTKLTLIIKQLISLKHFTAVYHSIKTFKISIF